MANKMKGPDICIELVILMCDIQSIFGVSANLSAAAAKWEGIFIGELWWCFSDSIYCLKDGHFSVRNDLTPKNKIKLYTWQYILS